MTSNAELIEATDAVDDAWRRWKNMPSAENEAGYDRAYGRWKGLGAARGVGRPPSGDTASLTSTERAQAGRLRQQQSAARWEKVVPYIQQIRHAVEASDDAAALSLAKSMIKETPVMLKNFSVIHAQPDSDAVVVHCWQGDQKILAFIRTLHLDDYFSFEKHLPGKDANLLVDRNLNAFIRIISAKFERGEHRPYSRFGSTLPRVDITLGDIETSGETLTHPWLSKR